MAFTLIKLRIFPRHLFLILSSCLSAPHPLLGYVNCQQHFHYCKIKFLNFSHHLFNWSLYMQRHTPLLWESSPQCAAYTFFSQCFRLVLRYRSPLWLKHVNCDECCLLSSVPHAVSSLCCMCLHVGVSEYVASIVLKGFKIVSFLHKAFLIFGEVIILRLICKYWMNFYLRFLDQKEMA